MSITNPDRSPAIAKLNALVPDLPNELLEYLKYWTPSGYQPQLLSDWQLLVLRLLWHRGGGGGAGTVELDYEQLAEAITDAIASEPKTMQEGRVMIVTGPGQTPICRSITINNIGNAPAIVAGVELGVDDGGGRTFAASPGCLLAPISYNATGTTLDLQYLVDVGVVYYTATPQPAI